MKTSFCSIAFRKSPQNIIDVIPIIANLGYDAIEVWGNHFNNSPLEEIKNILKQSNLEVSMVSPYMDLTAGNDRRRQSLDTAAKFIQIAAALNCFNIRVFTGIVGSKDATSLQWDSAVKTLKKICRTAAGTNINFALETHPKTLVDTVPSTLRLIEQVGEDNLKVNLDIYHMWEIHKDPLWVLDKLLPFVCHVHAKNTTLPPNLNGHYPLLHDKQASQDIFGITYLEKGQMPYADFIEALLNASYRGYISIEWFGDEVVKSAKIELAYLKSFRQKTRDTFTHRLFNDTQISKLT